MKNRLRLILLLVIGIACWSIDLFAQRSEAGITIGTAGYKGELNQQITVIQNPQPSYGLFVRRNLSYHYALRLGINQGIVYGADKNQSGDFEQRRNLSFRSEIIEGNMLLEFNFFEYFAGKRGKQFTPYIFSGLGMFYFNPQAEQIDPNSGEQRWIDLQPLGTEGQGLPGFESRKYQKTQMSIPFGGGFKWGFRRFGFQIEAGARKTFTDYLDDVSTTYFDASLSPNKVDPLTIEYSNKSDGYYKPEQQRGNSATNDWFFFSTISLTINLNKDPDACKPFKSKSVFFK